jgi:hypothetical protein
MVLAAILCSLAIISVANAQQPSCASHADITMQLSEKYAEVPVALGVSNNGGVMEIFTSPNGTTWTIVLTMPNGQSCMIMAGDSFNQRSMPTGGIDG